MDESLESTQAVTSAGEGYVTGSVTPGVPAGNSACQQPLCHLERNPGRGGGTNTIFTEAADCFLGVRIQ